MSPLNITQPLGIWSIMATIRWCPIFPKWDIYQPLLNTLDNFWLLRPSCFVSTKTPLASATHSAKKQHGRSNQNLSNVFNVVNSLITINIIYIYISLTIDLCCHMLKHTNMMCSKLTNMKCSKQFKYCIITPDSLARRCHQDPGGKIPSGGQPDIFSVYSSKVMLEMLRKWKYFVSWEQSWMPVMMPCSKGEFLGALWSLSSWLIMLGHLRYPAKTQHDTNYRVNGLV